MHQNYTSGIPTRRSRWGRGPALLAGIGLLLTTAHAQVSLYSFSSSTGATLHNMTGSTMLVPTGSFRSAVTPIGFDFVYEGTTYTSFSANNYGNLRLGSTLISEFQVQNLSGNQPLISPLSIDGDESMNWAEYIVSGTAPNRVLTVHWDHRAYSWDGGTHYIFQASLYEGTNVIEYNYGTGGTIFWWKNYVAITGANPANFLNVRPGHTVSSVDNTSLDAWPGNGHVYTFTPPAPCTTPVPGNTLASVVAGCSGISSNLSLQNTILGSGIGYQWQSSTTGGAPWTNVGTSAPTYTATAVAQTTWFRCEVTCSTGPSTVASTPVQITISDPAATYYVYNGTQYTQDFSSWGDRCSTTDVPSQASQNWKNTPAFGAATWRANTMTASAGWGGGLGFLSPNNGAVAPVAAFRSAEVNGSTGTLDFHVNMSAGTGTEQLRFEYVNSFGGGSLQVLVSQNGGSTFTALGTLGATTAAPFNAGTNNWVTVQYTLGATSAQTVIRLKGNAVGSGNPLAVDNLRIIPPPTCLAPTSPAASVTSPGTVDISFACSGCSGSYYVEYGAPSFTLGSGIVAGPFTGSPATISGLANGSYKAYVRQDCGGAGISENTVPVTFNIVNGDFCANAINMATLGLPADDSSYPIAANTAGAQNDYTSSPCGSMPSADVVLYHDVAVGATLSFIAQGLGSKLTVAHGGSCPGTTSLACGSGSYLTLGENVLPTGQWGDPTFIWTNNGCATERLYILVDGGSVAMWNYSYTPATGTFCAPVTGVAVNTVNTGTGVSVNWNATCSGNVVVEYGPAGFTPGTGTSTPATGTSTTLSGLDLDTAYDLYVRQDCGAGTLSAAGTAASFTLHAGDDCSRVIALNGVSGSIVINTTGANNDLSVCGSGHNGGDLILTHVVEPGYGIYFTSAPQGGYIGQVSIAYGSACPGTTELYCGPGAADHFWLNETGASQTVYLVQDGSDAGTTTIEWSIFEECALYDTDEDGINDCDDLCPELAGTVGDPCTVGGQPGTIGNDCNCVPTGCSGNAITIDIKTDANPDQTTWTIYDGSMNVVASGGPFTAANTVVSTDLCLPLSGDAYLFRVEDSFGDGLSGNGYWEVREQGGRVLLRDAFATGSVSPSATPAVASYGFGHQLLLPAGPANISAAYCGVYTYLRQQKVEADAVPGVSTYQFEFADPDAGFMRRIAVPRNWVRFNEMFSVPLVPGVTYFARVRVDQGAVGLGDDRFGGGCEIALQGDQTCTGLIDDASLPTFSCGVTRAFGASDKIWTYQVPGATQYRFRFVNTASSYVRTIVQPNYQCLLNWQSLPLVAGTTYDVSVEAYVSGAWKGYCGPVCQLTIAGGTAPALAPVAGNLEQVLNAQARIQLWPNPNTGAQVNVRAEGFATASNTVAIDVMDLAGKVAYTATVPVMDGLLNTVLDLGHLNNGVYMLRFTTGENMQVERLVISK